MFDYSKIHFFSKNGYEIPYDVEKDLFFKVKSGLNGGHDAILYGISSLKADGTIDNSISLLNSYDSGIVFNKINGQYDISIGELYENLNPSNKINIKLNDCSIEEIQVNNNLITSGVNNHYYGIKSLNKQVKATTNLNFPSIKYQGVLNFENVSTELFESECIYVLKEEFVNGVKTYKKIQSSDVENGRYKLLFLIDSSIDGEFRIFTVDEMSNDLTFTNSQYMSFTNDDTTGYRLNVAFSGKDEGVYEEKLYICIIDTRHDDEPYLLGTIKLHGESIGEDERYRTIFTNFGIPDPKEYLDIFKDNGIEEDLENKELLNKKSKELYLTYDSIFPYVGTYKSLINAINYLGYNDISFKEWYKKSSIVDGKPEYVSYDIAYKNEYSKNKINSLSIEERLSIKKLNWLTMKYKLNSEDLTTIDEEKDIKQGSEIIHIIRNEYAYRNDEVLLKLYALKKWLEKNIIAQNCRIIEIVGEGLYIERNAYNIYGNYTINYDFNSNMLMSPYLKGNSVDRILKDGSTLISIGVKELDEYKAQIGKTTISDISDTKFEDTKTNELYIDVESKTVKSISNGYDSAKALEGKHIIINGTLIHPTDFNYITIKASTSSSEYMFRSPYVGQNNLWIHEGEILFEPKNYKEDNKSKEVKFAMLPEIYTESINLRSPNAAWSDDNIKYSIYRDIDDLENVSFIVKNHETQEIRTYTDYPILKPQTGAYLKYTEYNYFALPLFMIKGFKLSDSTFIDSTKEYVIEIKDGKFAFENSEDDKYLYLNFNYDKNTSEQSIEVNTIIISEKIPVNKTVYNSAFVEKYLQNPDTAFDYASSFNISVNKAGIYDIYVYSYDKYNNVYGYKIPSKVEVVLESPEIELIAEQHISNNNEDFYYKNVDGTKLTSSIESEHDDNPIFKPTYLINDISVNDNSIYYENISYAVDTPKEDDVIRFYNATDRFKVTTFTSPYTIERVGSALSNYFPKNTNLVECVIFDTTYDNPIFVTDGSLKTTNNKYQLTVADSTFINYFKNVENPPHLYIRSINAYDGTLYVNEEEDFSGIIVNLNNFTDDVLFEKGQKIKLISTDKSDSKNYYMGVYDILNTHKEDSSLYIKLNSILTTTYFGNKKFSYKIQYPNSKFINYKIDIDKSEENLDGTCTLHIKDSKWIDFIDDTYSIGFRDFDIDNAYNDWIKTYQFNNLYRYDIPITLMNNSLVLRAKEPKYKIKNPSHYWIVYKRVGTKSIKYYELYNDTLFLNIDEDGIYDVELWTYDEYGNLTNKMNKGAFKK